MWPFKQKDKDNTAVGRNGIKERAFRARKMLDKIKTHKGKKKPFEGSLGVGISKTRRRKEKMQIIMDSLSK